MEAKTNREKLILFLALSILIHFLFLLFFAVPWHPELPAQKTVYVDLSAVPPPPATAEQEKKRQVVESENSPDRVAPKDAKYLSEHDQSVAEETKSRTVAPFHEGDQPSKAGRQGKTLSLKDLAPAAKLAPPTQKEIDGFREKQQEVARAEAAEQGSEGAGNPGAATNDYLQDVKDGDRTMLNTKEFVYYGYYRRIRERLQISWDSRLRATLESYGLGTRNLASRNYVTGVVVVLDRFGKVTAVQLLQQSGARDLDQAAVDAFNQAGPFPDPPAGLVDKNGEIRIHWDFIVQS